MLPRGTRYLCMCCLGRWTPVSTRPSLCAHCPWGWTAGRVFNNGSVCSGTRSSGGRVPSSEWRQSRSCSFSASGNTLPSSTRVYVSNLSSVSALMFCMFCVCSLWWSRTWPSLRGVCLSSLSLNLTSTSWLPNCDRTTYRALPGLIETHNTHRFRASITILCVCVRERARMTWQRCSFESPSWPRCVLTAWSMRIRLKSLYTNTHAHAWLFWRIQKWFA